MPICHQKDIDEVPTPPHPKGPLHTFLHRASLRPASHPLFPSLRKTFPCLSCKLLKPSHTPRKHLAGERPSPPEGGFLRAATGCHSGEKAGGVRPGTSACGECSNPGIQASAQHPSPVQAPIALTQAARDKVAFSVVLAVWPGRNHFLCLLSSERYWSGIV